MSHTSKILNRFAAKSANVASTSPSVRLDSVERTSNAGFSRIVLTVPTHMLESATSVLNSVRAATSNKFNGVADSFRVLASNRATSTLTGIVAANVEAVAYAEGMEGFRATAGNVFLDDMDQAWTLQQTASGNILIRSRLADDDELVEGLMSAVASSAQIGTSSHEGLSVLAADQAEVFEGLSSEDHIIFVNPETRAVEFGAIASTIEDSQGNMLSDVLVVSASSEQPVQIDRKLILGSVEGAEFDDEGIFHESTAASGHDLNFIFDYYRRVFQRSPDYCEAFLARWKSRKFAV